jgi:hypothetical protein
MEYTLNKTVSPDSLPFLDDVPNKFYIIPRVTFCSHLRESEYPHSLRDKVFDFSTRALSAKKIQLKKLGKEQKPKAAKAISADEENLMWEEGQLRIESIDPGSYSDPLSLLTFT